MSVFHSYISARCSNQFSEMIGIILFAFIFDVSSVSAGNGIGPLTADFQDWLSKNGYSVWDFPRLDMADHGSFGGRSSRNQTVNKDPVIIVHGNSDAALTANNFSTGFTNTVQYFLSHGYTLAELYATSWGDTNTSAAVYRDHDCYTLLRQRAFFEAVMEYTNKSTINIISHSMGVTLARKVIQGGQVNGEDGHCDLQLSISRKVDVFIGISGGNYGLCTCVGPTQSLPTCNSQNGLWPGDSCGANSAASCGVSPLPFTCNSVAYSSFLMDLNSGIQADGHHVFSTWSSADELIGFHDQVWGRPTSYMPSSTGKKIYSNFTHMQTKEDTAADQYFMITHRKIPS